MEIVNYCIIGILLIGGIMGYKKGAIKKFFGLIGFVAVIIIAYLLKGYISVFLIRNLPFFNIKGYIGLFSLNFLLYDVVSFVIVFVLLYCLLNILISLGGFVDYLDRMDIILKPFDKILGAVLGVIDTLVFVFLCLYIALQIPHTQKFVMESSVATRIVERTPIVNVVCSKGILVGEEVYLRLKDYTYSDTEVEGANVDITLAVVKRDFIPKQIVQETIKSGKLNLDNFVIA